MMIAQYEQDWSNFWAGLGGAVGGALFMAAPPVTAAGAILVGTMYGGTIFGAMADRWYTETPPPTGPATEVQQQQPPVSVFGAPPDSIPGSAKFRAK